MKKIVGFLAALLLAVSGCSSSKEGLTVGLTYVPDVQFFPFYVALENGYFDEAGLDVTLRHHGANEGLFTALATDREDIVYAGADELVVAASEGIEAQSFATMYQTYPLVVIVPEDSDITGPQDLHGTTLGIPGEFGSNYYAQLALTKMYGLDDMKVQSIGYTQIAALSRGDVDAVIGFINNDAVAMTTAGFPVRTFEIAADIPLVSVGLIASPATIDSADLPGLVEALDRAVTFAEEHPDETLDLVAKHVPTMNDRAAAKATLQATIPLYRGGDFGSQNRDTWEKMIAFLSDQGIAGPVAVDDVMREIAPAK